MELYPFGRLVRWCLLDVSSSAGTVNSHMVVMVKLSICWNFFNSSSFRACQTFLDISSPSSHHLSNPTSTAGHVLGYPVMVELLPNHGCDSVARVGVLRWLALWMFCISAWARRYLFSILQRSFAKSVPRLLRVVSSVVSTTSLFIFIFYILAHFRLL